MNVECSVDLSDVSEQPYVVEHVHCGLIVQEDPVLAYCGSFQLLQDMSILDVSSRWFFKGMGQLGHTKVGEITISVVPTYKFSPAVVFTLDHDLGMLLPCHLLCLVLI